MDSSILLTKLFIPSVPPSIIHRYHLTTRLTAGLKAGKSLTLVSAPAGYGKSTLIADWIADYQDQAAWLSLDDRDNNPLRFWKYFVTALQTVSKPLGQESLRMLESAQHFDPQLFLTALANELAAFEHLAILVLDDYHVISNTDIHSGVNFLLEHFPPSIHLVIVTRTDPLLPLSRMRVRGQLTEVRIPDLRFDIDESSLFLNELMDLGLTEIDIHALERRTEGWIAGLQLAALSMQGRTDTYTFIQNFTGSQHFVLEYLVEEVLQRQPEALQNFMIETSILQRMSAPLCNAVTGSTESANLLVELCRRNLFVIPLDVEHYWFRYHHLFAEFLKSHLKRTRANDFAILHHRAAEWFQANNHPEEALHHAFAIPDYAYVSRLVIDNWRRIYHQGRLNTAVEWLDSLPPNFVRQSPPLGVAYCWTLFVLGDYERIALYLDEITQVFEQMVKSGTFPKEHPEYTIIMQQVILLRAIVARNRRDVTTAINDIEDLLSTVAGYRQTLGQMVVDMGYTACYSQLGYTYVAAGDLHRAVEYLSRVSAHARGCGNIFALAHTTMELARISLLLGRLEQAERICRDELALAEQPAYVDFPAFCLIHLGLANVLCEKKSWDEAETHLHQGLEIAQKSGHMLYLAEGYLIAARLHHAQEKTTKAQEDLRHAEQIAGVIHNRVLDDSISRTRREIEFKPLPPQPLIEPLSERERDVLHLICSGKSNQEIADELFIALDTVKRHANNLYGKLGVKRRAQAIIEARRLGLD